MTVVAFVDFLGDRYLRYCHSFYSLSTIYRLCVSHCLGLRKKQGKDKYKGWQSKAQEGGADSNLIVRSRVFMKNFIFVCLPFSFRIEILRVWQAASSEQPPKRLRPLRSIMYTDSAHRCTHGFYRWLDVIVARLVLRKRRPTQDVGIEMFGYIRRWSCRRRQEAETGLCRR